MWERDGRGFEVLPGGLEPHIEGTAGRLASQARPPQCPSSQRTQHALWCCLLSPANVKPWMWHTVGRDDVSLWLHKAKHPTLSVQRCFSQPRKASIGNTMLVIVCLKSWMDYWMGLPDTDPWPFGARVSVWSNCYTLLVGKSIKLQRGTWWARKGK